MSLSATIALSQSSGSIHTPINAVVTVSNSGGSPINITTILPQIMATSDSEPEDAASYSTREAMITPYNTSVPAGGSSIFNFATVFHKPSTNTTYTVGCMICGADGSIIFPSAATVTITSIP